MVEFKGGVMLDSCLIRILLFADDTVVIHDGTDRGGLE